MIPQRLLETENSNHGLRNRVTACRKRLRESRVRSRVDANTEVEELFPEAPIAGSRLRGLSTRSNRSDLVSFMSLEEEVGIT